MAAAFRNIAYLTRALTKPLEALTGVTVAMRQARAPGAWPTHPLAIEPHVGQILADIVAWSHVPAFEIGRRDDDAIPPQNRHRIGLGERMTLEVAYDLRALLRVGADRLACGQAPAGPLTRAGGRG